MSYWKTIGKFKIYTEETVRVYTVYVWVNFLKINDYSKKINHCSNITLSMFNKLYFHSKHYISSIYNLLYSKTDSE